ncbi:MAG: leucyl aminopeptidase family protein [Pseudomonadota bacterium]
MTDETGAGAPSAESTAIPIQVIETAERDAALAELAAEEAAWARANGFTGKLGQSLAIPGAAGEVSRVLLGWGDAASRRRERFPIGTFAARAPAGTYALETALPEADAAQAALGWLLARYRFDQFKSKPAAAKEAELLTPQGVDAGRVATLAEGAYLARDLINTPANEMGPAELETAAGKIAARHGAEIQVISGNVLLENNLPLIHAVGRASDRAPRLIDFVWGAEDHPKLTLVGKGVCFDSGGLDLKPASNMLLMKKDMGGAANILALAHMVMARRLPVRLRVLIPAVENAVSGSSFRPGDVLPSRLGPTVEVNNTDAEGRLVLADALAAAVEDEPDLILDMATLTGAARVALGPEVSPFFTDDEALATALTEAGAAEADPVWRLPLWPGYERMIEPKVGDIDNAPSGGQAGAITAALFLKRFAGEGAWAHFDIYGWTPADRPGRPKGGECQAARACLRMLEARYGA